MVLVVISVYSDSFRRTPTTSDLQFPYVNFLWTFQTAVRENLEISSGNTGCLQKHRLDILTRCLTKQNLCPRFSRCSRQLAWAFVRLLASACVRFARVTRAGKCRSRQICSRHRSGVIINVHVRTSGKCNAHFLLGKSYGNAKFRQLNGDFRCNYRLIIIFLTNFTDEWSRHYSTCAIACEIRALT